MRNEIAALKAANAARAQQLDSASHQVGTCVPASCGVWPHQICNWEVRLQLTAKRVELLVHVMPDTLRGHQLRLSMYADALLLEQQKR